MTSEAGVSRRLQVGFGVTTVSRASGWEHKGPRAVAKTNDIRHWSSAPLILTVYYTRPQPADLGQLEISSHREKSGSHYQSSKLGRVVITPRPDSRISTIETYLASMSCEWDMVRLEAGFVDR